MFHTLSEGGLFKAHLYFPKEYPHRPPKMRFISEFWHPNGEFVIRILFDDFSSVPSSLHFLSTLFCSLSGVVIIFSREVSFPVMWYYFLDGGENDFSLDETRCNWFSLIPLQWWLYLLKVKYSHRWQNCRFLYYLSTFDNECNKNSYWLSIICAKKRRQMMAFLSYWSS